MDDLPELPFEKVLSYLSLEDRIKARAVSRRWRDTINRFKVKSLCFSERPRDFIFGKNRWVSGAFAQNFISTIQFASFFNTFGRSILSNLKHLRLCNLELNEEDQTAFIEILQSFGRLEELDIISFRFPDSHSRLEFKLSLPMLKSIHLERFIGIRRLTLDAPRLQNVRMDYFLIRMNLVHVESVESVTIDRFDQMEVKQLKNLKQLLVRPTYGSGSMDPTLLSGLKQLNEVHLDFCDHVPAIFEQRRRYGRTDLKIYLSGLLLSGPDDPEMSDDFDHYGKGMFAHWVENQSRLADEVPFRDDLDYSTIERVAPEVAINVLNRFIDLCTVYVNEPVQDTARFLDFLKNFDKITELRFWCVQPQELFDRLPENCAVQKLSIDRPPPDHQFLSRLKHLIELYTGPLDIESVRSILTELEFISRFAFDYNYNNYVQINIKKRPSVSFFVKVAGNRENFSDVNAVIEFIVESTRSSD